MFDTSEILNYLTTQKDRFQKEYHLKKLGIFGSVARNEHDDKSDIDLILEFEDNTSNLYEIKSKIKEELQNQFNRPVDICREKYIKPVFRKIILSEAIYV